MIKLHGLRDYKNFGDALSPVLIEAMTGECVRAGGLRESELVAVGSLLATGNGLYRAKAEPFSLNWLKIVRLRVYDTFAPAMKVWGTGFLYENVPMEFCRIRTLDVRAVRGRYTLNVLNRTGFCGEGQSVAFGDPGIFYPSLLSTMPSKKYEIGIVPHEVDRFAGEFVVEALMRKGISAKYIDVQDDPFAVLSDIASCRHVLSSSLHGLIVADALGIPNRQMMLSYFGYTKEQYLFKFRDYYSSYGLELPTIITPEDVFGSPEKIVSMIGEKMIVREEAIDERKRDLLAAFPYGRKGAYA